MHKYNRRTFVNFSQIFYDIVCIIISFFIAIYISYSDNLFENTRFNIWVPVLFSFLFVCFMYVIDMYSLTTFTYQDRALRNIMLSSILSYAVCVFMLMFVQPESANKLFFVIFLLVTLLMITCQYIISRELRKIKNNHWKSRAVIIGSRENIQEYLYYLGKTSFAVDILGYIPIDEHEEIPDLQILGDLSSLNSILTKYAVDEVVFALHNSRMSEIEPNILLCEDRGIIARVALDYTELNRAKSYIHSVGTIPVLTFHTVMQNNFKKSAKRVLDLVISFIGFVFFLVFSVFVIPFIKLSSKGPVFNREEYITLNCRTFKLLRYRTDLDKLIGRFLKRTGFAGLPQVLNVIKGQMSIVGTRPNKPDDVDGFCGNDFRRLSIKPGLTGLWRVNKHAADFTNAEITSVDERYIDNWSFARDIIIIVRTVFMFLFGKLDKV